jgi:hypothetical protein
MAMTRLIPITLICLLSGCATLSEDECRSANWFDIGLRDGHEGLPFTRIDEHREACSKFAISPDALRYRDGHAEGLNDYCRLGNAVRTGLRGQRYQGVCPGELGSRFAEYNEAAWQVYRIRQEIERVDNHLTSLERQLLDGKLSDRKRDELRMEIRSLDRDLFMLRMDLHRQEAILDRMMDALLRQADKP